MQLNIFLDKQAIMPQRLNDAVMEPRYLICPATGKEYAYWVLSNQAGFLLFDPAPHKGARSFLSDETAAARVSEGDFRAATNRFWRRLPTDEGVREWRRID